MGDNPWDRNAGKYDKPSSGLPGQQLREPTNATTESIEAQVPVLEKRFQSLRRKARR
jgi:hypothetical protein